MCVCVHVNTHLQTQTKIHTYRYKEHLTVNSNKIFSDILELKKIALYQSNLQCKLQKRCNLWMYIATFKELSV